MADMFAIPNAKRVRRDELYSSSSDEGSSSQEVDDEDTAQMVAEMNARLSRALGLDLSLPAVEQPVLEEDGQAQTEEGRQAEKPEEEYEFRLFSTSSKTAAPVKVVLAASDDEDADLGDGAFTVPQRPVSYYLAGEPTAEQIEKFRQTALAGDEILLGARKRAWGLERPWRLVKIGGAGKSARPSTHKASTPKATTTATTMSANMDVDEKEKRKRPGKKRRIVSRIKAKAEKEKREAAESQKLTKEEHLKEKKKRLNREKKLKRRAKEREQRLASRGQDGSQPAMSELADSGSEDESAA
ncbi:unnamed protein product [Discula destructiva]